MIREINGRRVQFTKASKSHIEGKECLYVGASGEVVELVESDNPDTAVRTSKATFGAFVDGAKAGEFDHLIA